MPYPTVSLLSSSDAAKILNVTHRSVTRWAREGLIPAYKMTGATGAYLFDPDVIETCRVDGITRDTKVVLQGARREQVAS